MAQCLLRFWLLTAVLATQELTLNSVQARPAQPPMNYTISTVLVASGKPNVDDINNDEVLNTHRNAIRDKRLRWPGGVVPFVIRDEFSQDSKTAILAAMKEIEEDVASTSSKCIQYVPRTTEKDYLEIRQGFGCSTYIGFYGNGVHYSTLGSGCVAKGIIMHELLHSLGFYHEQNRKDRDAYININTTNISKENSMQNFQIKEDFYLDDQGIQYDLKSIMHYGPFDFAEVETIPVMTPKPNYTAGLTMGQRYGLSELDVKKIQRLYECPEDLTHIESRISLENTLAGCNFEHGICNFQYQVKLGGNNSDTNKPTTSNITEEIAIPNTPGWVVQTTPSKDGPQAGHSNGVDPFLYISSLHFSRSSSENTSNRANVSTTGSSLPRTASIFTSPFILQEGDGVVCIDLYYFQAGPSTFLSIHASGPSMLRQEVYNSQGWYSHHWSVLRLTSTFPLGVEVRLEFMATVGEGMVAIDDVYVIRGLCN